MSMFSINKKVLLKTNWSTAVELSVISFSQKITHAQNDIIMQFINHSEQKKYTYHWNSTSQQGVATVIFNGKEIQDPTIEELARRLSCWFRNEIGPSTILIDDL